MSPVAAFQPAVSLEHTLKFLPERLVHKGINDRVGHVIDKMRVEDDYLKADNIRRHQPGRQEADYEN